MNFFEAQFTSNNWKHAFALGVALSQTPSAFDSLRRLEKRRSVEFNQEAS
jgi:hypothetical protein